MVLFIILVILGIFFVKDLLTIIKKNCDDQNITKISEVDNTWREDIMMLHNAEVVHFSDLMDKLTGVKKYPEGLTNQHPFDILEE
jgi:hypothetical protein